jgi:Cu2+-exporting ATPase
MTAVLEPEAFDTGRASLSACPACVAAPSAERIAELSKPDHARLMLSLPAAHCAACIATVEQAVQAMPGVQSARVNLTMKRVSVDADSSVTADALIKVLAGVGYEAHELDAGLLSATETDRQGRDLLMRLGVAFFSMMNVMLLSVAVWSGAEGVTRDLFHWISGAIAIPTVLFVGQPFFKSAWAGVKVGRSGHGFPDLAGAGAGHLAFRCSKPGTPAITPISTPP